MREKNTSIPVDKSLALLLDMKLSFRKYKIMQTVVNSVHKGVAKWIVVTGTSIQTPLQNMLNLTVKSYLDLINFDLKNNIICEIN